MRDTREFPIPSLSRPKSGGGVQRACTVPSAAAAWPRERAGRRRGILCFDGAINRRKAAVKRIESQVRSADVVKWPRRSTAE